MQEHLNDTRLAFNKNVSSTSISAHLSALIPPDTCKPISAPKVKELVPFDVEILWQGDPLTSVKTFGSNNCILCNAEKLQIMKGSNAGKNSIINQQNEIYGACRHHARFHRFKNKPPDTDESSKGRIKATDKEPPSKVCLSREMPVPSGTGNVGVSIADGTDTSSIVSPPNRKIGNGNGLNTSTLRKRFSQEFFSGLTYLDVL
jgi:hypothetical protein